MKFTSFGQSFEGKKNKLVLLPLEKLRCKPYPKKKLFQTMSLNELSDSIREYGVLRPILVKETGDGFYEIITGERRYRSSLITGKKDIPAVVLTNCDNNAAIQAIVQNLQEEDFDYMELAETYRILIVDHAMTQEEVARLVGKSQSSVANKVRLLKLPPTVVEILGKYALTERHARALLRLPNEEAQLQALKIITKRDFTVAETDLLIKKTLEVNMDKPKANKKNIGVGDIFNEIDLFISNINKSVEAFKRLGLKAKSAQFDKGSYFEIVIRLSKEREK